MSKVEGVVQKYFTSFQLSYENKTCSECQHDVRKTEKHAERQTDRQTDRWTERQIERQNDFSA
jgi:transcription initiation factor IIE alpha subunit